MIEFLGTLSRSAIKRDQLIDVNSCVHFEYLHNPEYLPNNEPVLLAVVLFKDTLGDHCIISMDVATTFAAVKDNRSLDPKQGFFAVAKALRLQPIDLSQPLLLSPISIAKPWGQEIWYTGIEARGISRIQDVPISWLLDIFRNWVFGEQFADQDTTAPLLLKILDPIPSSHMGDLYFEMHEKKVEVYVVTHIDAKAWPDGVGQIRYGFKQERVNEYADKKSFLDAYLDAVKNYELIRREIDRRIDDLAGAEDGQTANFNHDQRLDRLPAGLLIDEAKLRDQMYAFTSLRPLKVGDVVTVSPLMPHSLQHGVRVIEFQTPHYERFILSFSQKVLTQNHWDTGLAIQRAITSAPPTVAAPPSMYGMDLIADFDQFRVFRLELEAGESHEFDHSNYLIAIGIYGNITIGRDLESSSVVLAPERACLISAGEAPVTMAHSETTQGTSPATGKGCVLIAVEV